MEKQNMNRAVELFIKVRFSATHSLNERETPHTHVWNVEAGLTGPLIEGRIVSLPELLAEFGEETKVLEGTFLNANPALDPESRTFPTCENLIFYFEQAFKNRIAKAGWNNVELTELRISVVELDGREYGTARLRF